MKLYDFYANWCGPCKVMHPIIDEFGEKHPDLEIQKVNAEEDSELCEKFGVRNLPTFVVEDGDTIRKHTGALSLQSLENFVYA